MKNRLRQIRAVVLMGVIWGAAGFMVGMLIELIHNVWPNPLGRMVDIWPMALGAPAFLGGLAFSTLLGITGRNRKFRELSLPGFAALGAMGGVLVSLVPALMVAVGFADIKAPYSLWHLTVTMMVPLVVFGAAGAAGSLVLARRAEARAALAGGEHTSARRELEPMPPG